MQGKFITLEGIEGSGKSTNLLTIKSILDQYKIDYVLTREPGGGPLGPHLRKLLLDKDQSISPSVEMLLMMADRRDHVDNLINPNLDKGIWVISDRYLDSTIAYQGGGRQLDIDLITSLSASLKLPTPDFTLLFDLPVDVALERAKERSELDRFEREPKDFHSRIRESYLELASTNHRIKTIDSSKDFKSVSLQVENYLTEFLNA
jgi:dTMP kinase